VKYYLGIDSGGSKAAYALIDQGGETISLHVGAGYARTVDDTETTLKQIKAGVEKCLAASPLDLAHVDAVCIGLSYYGELSKKDAEIVSALRDFLTGIDCYLTNDCEVGWAGSLACKPGISIAVGTGSIAYGQNDAGQTARAGGWAHFFSDEGSCYWLGRKTMELFSKEADGRVPKTPLYDIIRGAFSLKDDLEFIELMEQDYIPSRKKIAELQILLEEAATQGDKAAILLYEKSCDELLLCIAALAHRLGFSGSTFPVSYSGGLFRSSSQEALATRTKEKYLVAPLRERVEALGGHLQEPLLEPYQGAVLCAIRQFDPESLDKAVRKMMCRS